MGSIDPCQIIKILNVDAGSMGTSTQISIIWMLVVKRHIVAVDEHLIDHRVKVGRMSPTFVKRRVRRSARFGSDVGCNVQHVGTTIVPIAAAMSPLKPFRRNTKYFAFGLA